ncbi:DUF4010 domain-containing protein [Bdellovibrio bacteriovorus]|uniref:DUF4010 domain-containing protein n=1 Tax=Bdellovibrio bacteriovorus TaxID=959 RepID=UPI0021CF0885|nr:DUF4010 domain-containing protein [Bdellovibrio bacteriovorus]UXR64985.1 DUF4010 domain-containing protein [Bdellovibrio bacteriovorus]
MKNQWVRAGLFLLFLFVASRLVPAGSIDPWGLFRPQKILFMFFALSALQVMGSVFSRIIGHRAGVLMTGFLGGLLSSTATTVSLSKDSHETEGSQSVRMAAMHAAILAMLLQAVVLVGAGSLEALQVVRLHFLILFAITAVMIVILWRRQSRPRAIARGPEKILDVTESLKLTIFIVLILAASRGAQQWLGTEGLMALTFVVSLFEVHGALISTAQLLAADKVGLEQYEKLVELSLLASFVSKFFLIAVISSAQFKKRALWSLLPAVLFLVIHLFGWIHLR